MKRLTRIPCLMTSPPSTCAPSPSIVVRTQGGTVRSTAIHWFTVYGAREGSPQVCSTVRRNSNLDTNWAVHPRSKDHSSETDVLVPGLSLKAANSAGGFAFHTNNDRGADAFEKLLVPSASEAGDSLNFRRVCSRVRAESLDQLQIGMVSVLGRFERWRIL
jgi:hypothetical protein